MTQHTNSVTAAALSLCVDVEVLAQFLPAIRQTDASLKERRADQQANPFRTYDATVIRYEVRLPFLPALQLKDESINFGQTALTYSVTPCMCKQGKNNDCTK